MDYDTYKKLSWSKQLFSFNIQGDPESDTDNENELREESSLDEERRAISRPQVSNEADAA